MKKYFPSDKVDVCGVSCYVLTILTDNRYLVQEEGIEYPHYLIVTQTSDTEFTIQWSTPI